MVFCMNVCTMYVMKQSVNGMITSVLYTYAKVKNTCRGMNGAMAYDKHHQIHLSPTFSMFTDSLVITDFWVCF